MRSIAVFSVPNQVWWIMFGDSIIDVNNVRSWRSLKELKVDLAACGLKLLPNNEVVSVK